MSRSSAFAVVRRLVLAAVSICAVSAGSTPAAAAATPQLLPYTITTVAGGASSNPAAGAACATGSTRVSLDAYGDGCLATQVSIPVTRAVVADTQNNLFIVDGTNNLIRRVDANTGVITLAAGGATATPASGVACASGSTLTSTSAFGDGCLATQVKLAAPEGITLDPSGNLWFTDYTLGSVRKVSKTTGIITTIVNTAGTLGYQAGNVAYAGTVIPAAQGMLVHPYGLTFDRQGNLYIADNYNNVVDVVNLGSTTATIAGTISVPAGAIYTIAGAGCAYGASTTGCSSYGSSGNGGASTGALLDSPYQVAVDNSGNIYIADEYPYDVRVINGSTGVITLFAGVLSSKSATIVRGPANTTKLASTFGVATDSLGNVYIGVYESTSTSSYIDRVDAATGIIYPVAGQLTTAQTAGTANASATYCSAKTDAIGDGCPGTSATLYKPYQPTVDAAGNVYVADQGNGLIRKISVGTQFPATAGSTPKTQSVTIHFGAGDTPASAAYSLTTGSADFTLGTATCTLNIDTTDDCVLPVTFNPTLPGFRFGQLTVKSTLGSTVTFSLSGTGQAPLLVVDPGTQATLSSTGLTSVNAIALDSAGNTYAALPNAASGAVVKLTAAGVASSVGTIAKASAVAVDALGNVYAALSTGTVVEVPASGAAQVTIGTGFTKPAGIAVDTYGNVFVSDQTTNQITEILVGSGAQTVVASGLNAPGGLALDGSGNIYVTSGIGNNVVEIPANGSASLSFGTGLSSPAAVALDAAGSLYVADSRNGRVVFIPNENGTLNSADQITIANGLSLPVGIAVSNTGNISVADSFTSAIYTFNRSNASIVFGNDAIGTQVASVADMINAGNQPVVFATPYSVSSGNTADFSLTPTVLTGGTSFAAGLGLQLTPGFKATATGTRTATYLFATTNAAQPKLTLTGTGIAPVNASTTTITANPSNGTYGQAVVISIAVSTGSGNPAATGTVTVKVDTTSYSVTLAAGAGSFSIAALNAGSHTVTASYPGDTLSSPSTATPVTVTLAKAPLAVVVNNATRAYYAANPTFTGTFTGVVNNDQVGIAYSSTAVPSSPLGTYPITAAATGTAAVNYALTVTPGVLTVSKSVTTTTVSASSTSVSATTSVVLTATVSPQAGTLAGGVPTGTVTFYNNGVQIGTPLTPNATGVVTYTTTFAVVGQSTNNLITAVYTGDTNFTTSTSLPLTIVSSLPGFNLFPAAAALSVAQGQYGLTNFTLTPTFGYTGTVTFSCTGLIATVGCTFSPATVTTTGTNTASLVALSITTQQAGPVAMLTSNKRKAIWAAIPAMALLLGFAGRRRKLLRGLRPLLMLGLCILGLGLSGCGGQKSVTGTAKGTNVDTITVVATGTPGTGSTTNITQQFTVQLTVN